MLSKNQIKYITNLKQKKFRDAQELFFVEGIKGVEELLASDCQLEHIYTTEMLKSKVDSGKITLISDTELQKISSLTTPNVCLGVFHKTKVTPVVIDGLVLALDALRDPGNLGTIIRLCDWFGVKHLVCSLDTVDVFNPKVIQATMGSITRVNIIYRDLETFILSNNSIPVYGTFMEGSNIYQETLPKQAIVVMGNEANGISDKIKKCITQKITIPRFGPLQATESLNVATATAITLSEFFRN